MARSMASFMLPGACCAFAQGLMHATAIKAAVLTAVSLVIFSEILLLSGSA